MTRAKLAVVLLCAVVAICAGCGPNQAKQRNDLKQLGLAYHNFHDANQKGPANWEELIAFEKQSGTPTEYLTRVRDAGYTVTWDLKLTELPQGMSNTVLAKPPGAGPTLMADGSVR